MPRQKFKNDTVPHQVNMPKKLDELCIRYCEDNNIDLRQLYTIALTRFMKELGQDMERLKRNDLQ